MAFSIIQCDAEGKPVSGIESMPQALVDNCLASAGLYRRIGFCLPWVSYVSIKDGAGVGGGAFVGPPRDGIVEIAYFTLPEYEARGYAFKTAAELCRIARTALPDITLSAFTLPGPNASTRILAKLGFRHIGMAHDDDAGEVWQWRT